MTKNEAIALFGSQKALAEAMDTHSPAVSIWPDELTYRQTIRVVGAAVLAGKPVRMLRELAG